MCTYLDLVGALYLNPMYTSVATPADYSAPLHTVQFFFLWFIFSSSVPAVQHHRREKDSTTLLIISSISPLACCLLLDSFRSISQFLLSWKFKVSIASLISLKSSSSKWVVGSERVPKSIWSPICLKGRSQRDPFNFSSSPFSDVTRTIYVWSTLPPVWLSISRGRERVIGLMGHVKFTHLHTKSPLGFVTTVWPFSFDTVPTLSKSSVSCYLANVLIFSEKLHLYLLIFMPL